MIVVKVPRCVISPIAFVTTPTRVTDFLGASIVVLRLLLVLTGFFSTGTGVGRI